MGGGKNTSFMTFLHIDPGAELKFLEFAMPFSFIRFFAAIFTPGNTSSSALQVCWLNRLGILVWVSMFICIMHYRFGTRLHLWCFVFIDHQNVDGAIMIYMLIFVLR